MEGEVEDAAQPPKPVLGAPEKHPQEEVIAGSMLVEKIGQLKIGRDNRVEQGVKNQFSELI